MSRDVFRTTTKSKMELSAKKGIQESYTFVTESPTPGSTEVLDETPNVLKNMLKITIKIK